MKKAHELMKESFALTHDRVDVSSVDDVDLGDYVMFKDDTDDVSLAGLPGHVRNKRDGKLDIYVGSSLRSSVDPSQIMKLVARS